ncbi:hypothetical protein GCM10022399_41210 [Terrabacter ginsenosidimutans]|uniref:Uncharacterized protein n=1 Tax=Terrabacter ginsenosidimutans TaxID=490575 RepID=A0ABP7EQY2_9MICO
MLGPLGNNRGRGKVRPRLGMGTGNEGWLGRDARQAKQIDGRRFGVYRELRKASALTQIDNLISAASVFNAVPIYAFYNSELAPFGRVGHNVRLGACGRIDLRREEPKHGPPGNSGFSPLGITVAHAEDVRQFVAPAPASSQHASALNGAALPWECLTCPSWAFSSSKEASPRISRLAAQIARLNSTDSAYQLEDFWNSPGGVWTEQPTWVQVLMQGGDPTVAEDAPPANFFLATAAVSEDGFLTG